LIRALQRQPMPIDGRTGRPYGPPPLGMIGTHQTEFRTRSCWR